MPLPTRTRRTAMLLGSVVVAGLALVPTAAQAESADDAFAAMAGQDDVQSRSGQAREENAALAELAASAEKAAAKIALNAWQLPIASGVYELTATFGQCSGLWSHCHTGLDFAAPEGTPIKALANGVVSETGWAGAYGNRTVITLDDGTDLWYCHQSQFGVKEGQPVVGGQTIGYVGSTGNSTGPHLHLEVRPGGGDAVDPARALAVRGTAP
ncbi:M23 family metallopeptidase [Nocardioides sp. HDW12B]|uniref:M23 family metallopeptidase n=1 Tax=Nocardioides sp. HDW12B TaxID=2714939 RepID=UPI00140D0A57|nr:M23 family metallopeptidase [Nocardioides sp. HDW12B]QIK65467.1 M23 family metallopeptidase [Nocardioides sp. HDW12B]